LTDGSYLGPDFYEETTCNVTLGHTDSSVELTEFSCSQMSLLDPPASDDDAHVVDEGFGTNDDHTAFGVIVESGDNHFFFTANRQSDLISGIVVRQARTINPDPSPVDTAQPSEDSIIGAFYLEEKRE